MKSKKARLEELAQRVERGEALQSETDRELAAHAVRAVATGAHSFELFEQYRGAVAENIAKHGQHLVGVTGPQPFTYTVGLMPHAGYELIVYALPHEVAAVVLNEIGAWVRDGLMLALDTHDSRFTSLPVKFIRCGAQAQEVNGVARCHYGGDVPMVQMVLCDRAGKFPGDAEFDHAYMDRMQPLLQ